MLDSPVLDIFRLIIMMGAGVSCIIVGRMASKTPRTRITVALLSVVIAILAALSHYHPLRSILGNPLSYVGGEGAVAGYALLLLIGTSSSSESKSDRSSLQIIGGVLSFAIILVFACTPLAWRYFGGAMRRNYPNPGGWIQQSTGMTCAPSAGVMLLSRYGIRVSEGTLAQYAGTNILVGTNEYQLARAMETVGNNKGLRARASHITLEEAKRLRRPFVAYITLPGIGGHAVLVISIAHGTVTINDPLSMDEETISTQEFSEEWSGVAVWVTDIKQAITTKCHNLRSGVSFRELRSAQGKC